MNIACVDDKREVLQEMEAQLRLYGDKKHADLNCTCYEDTEAFLRDMQRKQFSIVFMDIYFDRQEMNGLEAARKLRQIDPQCIIVFLTSSADHMPEAFAVHAFSYIMKDNLDNQLEKVMNDALKVLPVTKNLIVMQGSKELVIPHQAITCAYTDRHYVIIRIQNSEALRLRMTFHELFNQLDPEERFLQINKGVLVNMDYVQTIEEGNCGMNDGTWLPVRHRDRNNLIATWRSYQFKKIREGQS